MSAVNAGGRRDLARPAPSRGEENLYIVAYDIAAPGRWRKVYRIMEGYGEWVQLSVFQCRLARRRQIEMKLALDEVINHAEDHVIIIDIGPAAANRPRIESLGKPFSMIERDPIIVQDGNGRRAEASSAVVGKTRRPLAPMFDLVEERFFVD